MTLIELREKRARVLERARKINDDAQNSARGLDSEGTENYTKAMDEFYALSEQIERAEELDRHERDMAQLATTPVDQNSQRERDPESRAVSFRDEEGREIRSYNHDESIVNTRGWDSADVGNLIIEKVTGRQLLSDERRAAQVDKDLKGGFLMHGPGALQLWDLARSASVVSQAGARTVPFQAYNRDFHLATVESDPQFSWVPELKSIALDDNTTFGSLRFRCRKVATRIEVSDEFMRFTNGGPLITRLLQTALAQEIDRAALVGTGDGEEPVGILNTTGIGTTAVGGAITVDTMIDTVTTLQALNVTPNAFVTTPAINGAMDKLKYGDGHYIKDWPGDTGRMSRYITSKMDSGALIMGRFSDLVLAPAPEIAIDIVKDIQSGKGSYLVQVVSYFDCGCVWPAHFHSLTGITT